MASNTRPLKITRRGYLALGVLALAGIYLLMLAAVHVTIWIGV